MPVWEDIGYFFLALKQLCPALSPVGVTGTKNHWDELGRPQAGGKLPWGAAVTLPLGSVLSPHE